MQNHLYIQHTTNINRMMALRVQFFFSRSRNMCVNDSSTWLFFGAFMQCFIMYLFIYSKVLGYFCFSLGLLLATTTTKSINIHTNVRRMPNILHNLQSSQKENDNLIHKYVNCKMSIDFFSLLLFLFRVCVCCFFACVCVCVCVMVKCV